MLQLRPWSPEAVVDPLYQLLSVAPSEDLFDSRGLVISPDPGDILKTITLFGRKLDEMELA